MQFPFKPLEIRVLGCLIEKELTTPEYYPLTPNALALACSQKNNRHPVQEYNEHEVRAAAQGLAERDLCRTLYQNRSRTGRYLHRLDQEYSFTLPEKAILAELFLRGPQTPGELHTRAARMAPLSGLEEVLAVLEGLATRTGGPFVMQLARQPGQKEARYAHLFCGTEGLEEQAAAPAPAAAPDSILERVARLEEQVAALTRQVEDLRR
jgi:uncharacterized protein YceH (UPF0502 family)